MFSIGDVIIYSVHGLSRVDDICENYCKCDQDILCSTSS